MTSTHFGPFFFIVSSTLMFLVMEVRSYAIIFSLCVGAAKKINLLEIIIRV